jgi:Xaa-Pro dipeptidase
VEQVKEYVSARIKKIQDHLKQADLGGAILVKPENVFYFSNFNPILNSHPVFLIITPDREPRLLVHCIRYNHAREEGAIEDIQCYGRWGSTPSLASTPEEAIALLLGKDLKTLGLEFNFIPIGLYETLRKDLEIHRCEDITSIINTLRIIKDPFEISCIRSSAALVDRGVEATIEFLDRGYSEAQACTEGQYAMRQLWQEKYPTLEVSGFGTWDGGMIDSLHVWSLTNEHIAYGTDCPRSIVPQQGDLTLPMAWASVGGYHGENERTLIVGTLSGIRERAYEAMLAAREGIFAILKPGVAFEALYAAAAGEFTAHGFGDILPGRVGHGVGLSAHEFPSLAKGNTLNLQPGMVITVEPGLMDSAWGGARHSDTVLITGTGYEVLTKIKSQRIIIRILKNRE